MKYHPGITCNKRKSTVHIFDLIYVIITLKNSSSHSCQPTYQLCKKHNIMFKGHKNRKKMAKNPTSFKIMEEKRNCHEETINLGQLSYKAKQKR